MTTVPEIRYARSEGVHLAYQVFGSGPPQVVLLPEWVTHLEALWEWPLERGGPMDGAASFAEVLMFDKRGVGLSDPVPLDQTVSLEAWMDDLRIVTDAVGWERPVLLGFGQGVTMALLFAATFPDRVGSLVLVNGYARLARAPDYPWGLPGSARRQIVDNRENLWGTAVALDTLAPTVSGDERLRSWWSRVERLACSPGTARMLQAATLEHDVRHVLGSITAPTLVVHVKDNRWIRVGHGRYLAEHIPAARYVEHPGQDHWWWVSDNAPEIEATIQSFLLGAPREATPRAARVLTTLVFTDTVGSTEHAAAVGDGRWRAVLDALDALVARQIERFDGSLVKSTGDGHLMTFNGPGRAVHCATAIRDGVRALGLALRIGVHTGEVEVRGDDIGGIAVHIAARVMQHAGAGEIVVSGVVPPLVAGSGLAFDELGVTRLDGIPGDWPLYRVGT